MKDFVDSIDIVEPMDPREGTNHFHFAKYKNVSKKLAVVICLSVLWWTYECYKTIS